ncbi:MAG: ABC transporter ATP-binding protein [Methanoregula sp.]|nr:MAG: ABC transporter ATP-binding protein [Methanoregula sp.]
MNDYMRIFSLWRTHWKWLLLSLLLTVGGAIGTLAVPALSQELIDLGIMAQDTNTILAIGFYMFLATVLTAVCQVLNTAIAVKFSEQTAHYLRTGAYDRVQALSFGDLDRLRPSDLLVRLTTDVQNAKIAIQQGILNLPLVPVMLVTSFLLIAYRSPSLVWLMVVILAIFTILLSYYLLIVVPLFTLRQKKYDGLNQALQESMAGIRVVKAFVRQRLENERFASVAGEVKSASLKAQHVIALLIPTMIFVVIVAVGAIYFLGGTQVLRGTGFSLGQVTASVQYLFLLIMPFMILGAVLPAISASRPSFHRIFEVIDAEAEVRDRPGAIVPGAGSVHGKVVFKNVEFGYIGNDGKPGPLVLKNISFTAEPGETVGFLGPTGSGKSTLVQLIPRFYDVTRGQVTIDGTDVRDIPQDRLREIVGICLQQPNLFSGTVRENILFGAADQSDGNMVAAARDADADTFIANIPGRYDEAVARHGTNFSGGQRQRLCIARTLAQKPKVLILDDSTSACDVATEARIQDAVNQRFPGVTKLIVAQRISTVIAADRIILLENGGIIAAGRHEDLLAQSPEYREIYDSQLGSGIVTGGGP